MLFKKTVTIREKLFFYILQLNLQVWTNESLFTAGSLECNLIWD